MLACQRSRIEENTYFSCIFFYFIFWHKYLNLVGLPYINFNEFFVALEIATPGKPSKKRKPDDTWEHAIPLDEKGEATRCRYCGFVSRCGGIARLQAHLGGGNLAMQVDFCPNVPPEIRNLMAGGKKKYKNKSKGVLQGKAYCKLSHINETLQEKYSLTQLCFCCLQEHQGHQAKCSGVTSNGSFCKKLLTRSPIQA